MGTSPQTVTLTGLTADGNNVDVTAFFTNATTCNFTENNAFTAPANCTPAPCSITGITAGTQSACDPVTDTYSQEIIVTYSNIASGILEVNGQLFPITSSPQTVLLSNLPANGQGQTVSAALSANPFCNYTENLLFTAPNSCATAANFDSLVVMMYPNGAGTLFVGSDVITNTPHYGYYPSGVLLDINAQVNTGNTFDFWSLNNQVLIDYSATSNF